MNVEQFQALIMPIADAIDGRPVNSALADELERRFPPGSKLFKDIEAACHAAIKAGWMCNQGGEGRRFGRVIQATPVTHDLSVDVVDLKDIVGPHHKHPNGEVCMVMPIDGAAKFDGKGAGWKVYKPGSAHRPTVTGGEALVLYLLPHGAIEFTEQGKY